VPRRLQAAEGKDVRRVEDAGVPGAGLSPEDVDATVEANGLKCPGCEGPFEGATAFNMMFPVAIGPEGKDQGFLRPETAQGAYLAFKREHETLRRVLPLGLAIIGRAFRNEISPRLGAFRLREFIQAELQIFFNPDRFDDQLPAETLEGQELGVLAASEPSGKEAVSLPAAKLTEEHDVPRFFVHHMVLVREFYVRELGIPPDRLRFHEVGEGERAHYNRIQYDVEVDMESLGGYREVAGIHYRGDYDLAGHQAKSSQKMAVLDGGEKVVPHVLELSFGIDRTFWALLDVHYEKLGDWTVLHLPPALAPVQVGVFPHMRKDGLREKALDVHRKIRGKFRTVYDDAGSIGKRYARMDEVGTPYCVTVDHPSLEGEGVTVRDRDTRMQVRVDEGLLVPVLGSLLAGRGLPAGLSFEGDGSA
jgi:glycyl-tRNA synthetase